MFQKDQRDHYRLEDLWADAKELKLNLTPAINN